MGRIAPYLLYEDGAAAIDFLTKAFGFEEVMRMDEGGIVNHAELRLGDDSIMLGSPGEGYESPRKADHRTSLVHVYVDDVDTHFERAKAAGAEIVQEPTDQEYGDRRYDAKDPEGQLWSFATTL
ncbi:MAG TPA: VOC family protein [Gaiellaceae bacterium]|nr:VOC family protein [Gaiellaceae bacterium]